MIETKTREYSVMFSQSTVQQILGCLPKNVEQWAAMSDKRIFVILKVRCLRMPMLSSSEGKTTVYGGHSRRVGVLQVRRSLALTGGT